MLMQSSHRIIHLSDTHFTADRAPLFGKVDCDANLAAAFDRIEASGMAVDAILLSGDLADTGDPGAYRRLRAMLDQAQPRFNCPLLPGMGNHDVRENFRAEILGDQLGAQHVDYCTDVRGLRIVNVDSTVPGRGYGELDQDQLQWLRDELATPAEHGSILVIHHPPVPTTSASLASIGLLNPEQLADVLADSDVRLILSGHWHTSTTATFAGIPVVATSSLAYPADPVNGRAVRGTVTGQSFNVIEVFAHTIVVTNAAVERRETLFEIDFDAQL